MWVSLARSQKPEGRLGKTSSGALLSPAGNQQLWINYANQANTYKIAHFIQVKEFGFPWFKFSFLVQKPEIQNQGDPNFTTGARAASQLLQIFIYSPQCPHCLKDSEFVSKRGRRT